MKRLDLAINDKTGILNIPHLTEKCRNEECISVFRSFKSYRSGELVRRGEKECMGNTLYIGSLQSEVYFCIYEKDYEQYKKHDIPIADAEVKNRFEIRLKNERAFYAIRDLLEHAIQNGQPFKSSTAMSGSWTGTIQSPVLTGVSMRNGVVYGGTQGKPETDNQTGTLFL